MTFLEGLSHVAGTLKARERSIKTEYWVSPTELAGGKRAANLHLLWRGNSAEITVLTSGECEWEIESKTGDRLMTSAILQSPKQLEDLIDEVVRILKAGKW